MAKHYAISDLHGCYNIYEQVCAILEPDDIVYFLGDACDRGYNNWQLVKDIYNNPQWFYLKGNHEDLLVKAYKYGETTLWYYNGGYKTCEEIAASNDDINKWIEKLNGLPLMVIYQNTREEQILLSHSGFTLNRPYSDYIWDRSHIIEETWRGDWSTFMIHGHTPIPIMVDDLNKKQHTKTLKPDNPCAYVYCHGHKINIDNGVFYTGYTVLYDLDEHTVTLLYDENIKRGNDE